MAGLRITPMSSPAPRPPPPSPPPSFLSLLISSPPICNRRSDRPIVSVPNPSGTYLAYLSDHPPSSSPSTHPPSADLSTQSQSLAPLPRKEAQQETAMLAVLHMLVIMMVSNALAAECRNGRGVITFFHSLSSLPSFMLCLFVLFIPSFTPFFLHNFAPSPVSF